MSDDQQLRQTCWYEETVNLPIETIFQTLAFGRTALVDRPLTVFELAQTEFLPDLTFVKRTGQVLFVGKDEQLRIFELLF